VGAGIGQADPPVNSEIPAGLRRAAARGLCRARETGSETLGRKPDWAIEKERARRAAGNGTVWLFGLHAVRDALVNPARRRRQLVVTPNAADRLADAIAASGLTARIADPRRFDAPLDAQSVHQGAALEAEPLDWGSVSEICAPHGDAPLVLLLDRVSDPHNVGAILRSAEVFGARAVVAPRRHAAPETGALAKAASGALERQPYLRVPNLARAMATLGDMGYVRVALDGDATTDLDAGLATLTDRPVALVLGAEGPGLRELTTKLCDLAVRIPATGSFGSLNVSNAAAIALYAARRVSEPPITFS
jgi:23S rRNA (guanosine2251-2'-O)-methyltransferase